MALVRVKDRNEEYNIGWYRVDDAPIYVGTAGVGRGVYCLVEYAIGDDREKAMSISVQRAGGWCESVWSG